MATQGLDLLIICNPPTGWVKVYLCLRENKCEANGLLADLGLIWAVASHIITIIIVIIIIIINYFIIGAYYKITSYCVLGSIF